MELIYGGILAALAALLFLSRKEKIRAEPDTPALSRYFLKPAQWLYQRLSGPGGENDPAVHGPGAGARLLYRGRPAGAGGAPAHPFYPLSPI